MGCLGGHYCPYLKGGDVWRLIAERRCFSQRFDEMQGAMTAAEAKIESLRQENKRLTEENKSLSYHLKQMLGKIFKPQ